MPLVLYKEAGDAETEKFRAHLASCQQCSATFGEMEETLRTMDRRQPVSGRDVDWDLFWTRLAARIGQDHAQPARKLLLLPRPVPRWAYGIAAVLLVAVGIYLGRFLYPPEAPPSERQGGAGPVAAESADTAGVDARLQDYLDRSKALLLGVVNSETPSLPTSELRREQQVSRDLVGEAAFLKAALNRPDRQQLRMLVEDLEIILLQLSNMELKPGVPVVEMIREGVDRRSVLLKINVEEIRAAVRQTAASSSAGHKPKSAL